MSEQINRETIVNTILKDKNRTPKRDSGEAFAPANIALCKYWGKRGSELNLPVTNSLSVSLGDRGAKTRISVISGSSAIPNVISDEIYLNGKLIAETPFTTRLSSFLDLFRDNLNCFYRVETDVNIPIAAGLASSAAGFASIVKALDNLYAWELPASLLSVLARLGSGSAARSIWQGFVEWHKGERRDGMDSLGLPISHAWPELRIGLLILNSEEKSLSSRTAMEMTVKTSPFYREWPQKVALDLQCLKMAIETKDFNLLGKTSESNALAMHALMMTAYEPIIYSTPETLKTIQKIWALRKEGISIYFTQDAGPNLKLLFLQKDEADIVAMMKSTLINGQTLDILSPIWTEGVKSQ